MIVSLPIFSRSARALTVAALLTAPALATAGAATPAPAYDGNWSVLIVTTKGECDRGYRYPVRISRGAVGYAGEATFNVSGRVSDTGAITVTVSRGDKSAHGTGKLSGNAGAGSWKAGAGECAGTWTAERRS
jgi:hypothetical protein